MYDRQLERAVTDQAVTITLNEEVDVSRGDVLASADDPCEVSEQFDASLVWMDGEEGYLGRSYWLMLGTKRVNATITDIKHKYNVNTLEQLPARSLGLNDIGRVTLSFDTPAPFEAYRDCRGLGAFVLVDRYTNATVGAGMLNFALRRAKNIHRHTHAVDKPARAALNGPVRVRQVHGCQRRGACAVPGGQTHLHSGR